MLISLNENKLLPTKDQSFGHDSDFVCTALLQQLQLIGCLLIYTHGQNKLLSIHSKHGACGVAGAQVIWNSAESTLRVFQYFWTFISCCFCSHKTENESTVYLCSVTKQQGTAGRPSYLVLIIPQGCEAHELRAILTFITFLFI